MINLANEKMVFEVWFDGKLLGHCKEPHLHGLVKQHMLKNGIKNSDIMPGMIDYKFINYSDHK